MSKSWTPEELAAASAAMKAEGHMSYEEFCAAPRLRLEFRGRDSWDRPVYECDGRLYSAAANCPARVLAVSPARLNAENAAL